MVDAALAARATKPEFTADEVQAHGRGLGENAAGLVWREAARAVYATLELPSRVRHLWKYTDPVDLLPPRSVLGATPVSDDDAQPDLPDGPAVLLRPGQEPRLTAAAVASGVTVARLFAGEGNSCPLGSVVPPAHGFFEALNAVAFDASCLVRVPRNAQLVDPLRIIVPAAVGQTVVSRVLVDVAAGAQVTIVEEHSGGGKGSLTLGVTEIRVGPGANARHVLVQRWESGARGHLTVRARAERDATYLSATASFGGDIAKVDLGCELAGPGARSELVGVALAERRQHLDHHTAHRHTADHTWSNINFKAAVAGRARSSYTGLISIAKDAPTSEAYQENRNLLLSEHARADSIPELEILTDDVSCSHGATVAPIDPEQVFYLQSRGIPADEAMRLVVRGFVESTLRLVPVPLRDQLGAVVEARLAALQGRD